MTWSESIGIGITTAVAAFFAGTGVMAMYFEWRLASGDESYSTVFLASTVAFFAGIAISRLVGHQGFGHAAAYSVAAVFLVCGSMIGYGWANPDEEPKLNGEPLTLEAELQCPPGWTLDYRRLGLHSLGTWSNFTSGHEQGWAKFGAARQDATGRWIIPLSIELKSSRDYRLMTVGLGRDGSVGFRAPIPGHPTEENQQWSPWASTDLRSSSGYNVRARVRRASVLEAEQAAGYAHDRKEREQQLKALSPGDPLERWLALFEPGEYDSSHRRWQHDDPIWPAAREVILTKMSEYQAALRSPDRMVVWRALSMLERLGPIPRELSPDIEIAGRKTLDFIQYAQSRALPEAPDLQAGDDAENFYDAWRFTLTKAAGQEGAGLPIVSEIAKAVESETSGSLAQLHDSARVALGQSGNSGS